MFEECELLLKTEKIWRFWRTYVLKEVHTICISIGKLSFFYIFATKRKKRYLWYLSWATWKATGLPVEESESILNLIQRHQNNKLVSLMEVWYEVYCFSHFCSWSTLNASVDACKDKIWLFPTITSLLSCFPWPFRVTSWKILFVKICLIFKFQRCVKNSR